MINIGSAAYDATRNYSADNERTVKSTDAASGVKAKKSSAESGGALKRDTVSLSDAVEIAKLRESLGLNPTGKLSKNDIEAAASADEEKISSDLDAKLEQLGIDKNEKISLSLNATGAVVVGGKFSGKKELQKALNGDDEFKIDFERYSTNQEILDYTDNLDTHMQGMNLFSDMNDTEGTSLLDMATSYKQTRGSENPLVTLMQLSRDSNPLEYVYAPEAA